MSPTAKDQEQASLPQDGDGGEPRRMPSPFSESWQEIESLGQTLVLWGGRQGAREIRIGPGEEIVVEGGKILVREAKAHGGPSED